MIGWANRIGNHATYSTIFPRCLYVLGRQLEEALVISGLRQLHASISAMNEPDSRLLGLLNFSHFPPLYGALVVTTVSELSGREPFKKGP